VTEDSTADVASDPRPAPGTRTVFRWRKWDGAPHWLHDCVYLGADEWGDWFGQLPGWSSARPGLEYEVKYPSVTLMPPSGDFAYTRNAPPHRTQTYIDLAWDLRWDAGSPTGIDMDLDVVRRADRGVWIDDRDEWDEHRVQHGYPLDIVEHLETLAVDLEARVRARVAPFDDASADAWLDRLAELDAPDRRLEQ